MDKRTNNAAFFDCPVCGKRPRIKLLGDYVGIAYCTGYGFHRHKRVLVSSMGTTEKPLYEALSIKWNLMHFDEVRFIYNENGNPFKRLNTKKRLTNREEYAEELIEIALSGNLVCLVNGEPDRCESVNCLDCDLYSSRGTIRCTRETGLMEWAEQYAIEGDPERNEVG